MKKTNRNEPNLGNETNSKKHWGNGHIVEGKRVYHPYTAYDFINPVNKTKNK